MLLFTKNCWVKCNSDYVELGLKKDAKYYNKSDNVRLLLDVDGSNISIDKSLCYLFSLCTRYDKGDIVVLTSSYYTDNIRLNKGQVGTIVDTLLTSFNDECHASYDVEFNISGYNHVTSVDEDDIIKLLFN